MTLVSYLLVCSCTTHVDGPIADVGDRDGGETHCIYMFLAQCNYNYNFVDNSFIQLNGGIYARRKTTFCGRPFIYALLSGIFIEVTPSSLTSVSDSISISGHHRMEKLDRRFKTFIILQPFQLANGHTVAAAGYNGVN